MSRISAYFKNTVDELLYKVSWPTWGELQNSSVIVLIASLIIGFIVFAMDKSFSSLMGLIYETLGSF